MRHECWCPRFNRKDIDSAFSAVREAPDNTHSWPLTMRLEYSHCRYNSGSLGAARRGAPQRFRWRRTRAGHYDHPAFRGRWLLDRDRVCRRNRPATRPKRRPWAERPGGARNPPHVPGKGRLAFAACRDIERVRQPGGPNRNRRNAGLRRQTETVRAGHHRNDSESAQCAAHEACRIQLPRPRSAGRCCETIESEQEILADGSTRTVESTWALDSSGRPGLTSRQIQQTRSPAPDVKQTDTVVFRPGTDGALQENERIQQTERQLRPDLLQTSSTRSVRDINSRFQRTEERSHEVRTIGPTRISGGGDNPPAGHGSEVVIE